MNNRFLIVLISIISVGCAMTLEYVAMPVQTTDWKIGYQKMPRSPLNKNYIIEHIPKEDDINNWSKIITIQFIDAKSNVSPKEFVSSLISDIKIACPDAEWDIIESNARSIIYEWYTKTCESSSNTASPNINTPQHEIARIIFSNEGIHKVSYNEKTTELNTETRKQWLSNLRDARVEKDGKTVNLQ